MSTDLTLSKSLAEKAQGRIISAHVDITLTPPQTTLGDTDDAWDIGKILIGGAMDLLRKAASENGFKVEIDVRQIVY